MGVLEEVHLFSILFESLATRRSVNKRITLILAGLAIVLVPSFFAWKNSGKDSRIQATGTERAAPASLPVSGFEATAVPFSEEITANGTLQAEESIELQAEVSGKVVALNFIEGQVVAKGQLLVKIDDSVLQASLRRSLARRHLASLQEVRFSNLIDGGGISQIAFDEARGEVEVIDADVDAIKAEIAKTEIRAPFDGVVGIRFLSVGAYVNPSTRIATLQGLTRMKVDFSVPERYASIVSVGDPIRFTVAGDSHLHTGEVYAVEPRVDVATRSILVRALCDNRDGTLLPGNFARVQFTVEKSADAILVPSIALISGLEERFLFVSREGIAERISVKTGARTASHVQIREGLAPGDVVITSGIQQLRQGLAVSVTLAP